MAVIRTAHPGAVWPGARPAARPFVANDKHIARMHAAAEQRVLHLFLAVKNARPPDVAATREGFAYFPVGR